MTYQSSIVPRLDTIEHSLEILGRLTPGMKQKLDDARTRPDALETAMSAAIDTLETASLSLASHVSEVTQCLAVYVAASEKMKLTARINIGIPYAIEAAAMKFTAPERARMTQEVEQ
jgi:hypothetical protein